MQALRRSWWKWTGRGRLYPRWIPATGLACYLGLAFWVEPKIWAAGLSLIAVGLVWHGIAYKIGFEQSPDVYYSFSGGVLPRCRRQGIARALIAEQHRFARELGYRVVRTHTKNIYREMLLLDIASGFDVVGVIQKTGEELQSIVLEKLL